MSMPPPRTVCFLFLSLTASNPVAAQGFVCRTVQPGDTAAAIALRWTGTAASLHQRWFQIRDPIYGRVVPKARYGRILPGWQACVATSMAARGPAPVPFTAGGTTTFATANQFGTNRVTRNPAYVGWALLCLSLSISIAWPLIESRMRKRQLVMEQMKRFGDRFIEEFERPLVRSDRAARPIKSQLRLAPRRCRVDILLAPNDGRLYPNLSDHRQNVEYDVERIVQRLGKPFICGPLYSQGAWVAIPFQFIEADTQRERVA